MTEPRDDATPAARDDARAARDDAFLAAIERGTFPKEQLDHRAHLRLLLLLVQRGQAARIGAILRAYVAAIGVPEKYNETLTQAWLRLVLPHAGPGATVDSLVAAGLGDSGLPLRHYSQQRLWSEEARAACLPPDLRPF